MAGTISHRGREWRVTNLFFDSMCYTDLTCSSSSSSSSSSSIVCRTLFIVKFSEWATILIKNGSARQASFRIM